MTLHPGDMHTLTRIEADLQRRRLSTERIARELRHSEDAPATTEDRRISGRVGYTIAGSAGLLIVLLAAVLG